MGTIQAQLLLQTFHGANQIMVLQGSINPMTEL